MCWKLQMKFLILRVLETFSDAEARSPMWGKCEEQGCKDTKIHAFPFPRARRVHPPQRKHWWDSDRRRAHIAGGRRQLQAGRQHPGVPGQRQEEPQPHQVLRAEPQHAGRRDRCDQERRGKDWLAGQLAELPIWVLARPGQAWTPALRSTWPEGRCSQASSSPWETWRLADCGLPYRAAWGWGAKANATAHTTTQLQWLHGNAQRAGP